MKLKALSLGLALSLTSSAVLATIAPVQPEPVHRVTTLEILQQLDQRHYVDLDINDQVSKDYLEHYLKVVDSGRQVLLQSDVDKFNEKYGKSLDDAIKKGDVKPGFDIFNTYRKRMTSLLERQLENMEKTISQFDYSKDESIIVDREAQPWPKTERDINELARKRLKAAALSLSLSGKEQADIVKLLTKRYQNQLDRLQKINSEDVYQLYINAFTQLYDPHTNYFSPAASKNFDISMSLKLEGIGAILRAKDDYTQIVRLIHGGPAFKQGALQPADKIVGVAQGDKDMVDVIGWRLDEVVDLIRGPKGSKVRLDVVPAKALSDSERKEIVIVRDEVKLEDQSVKKAMIEMKDENGISRKIGVLDIPAFYIDFEALKKRDPNYKSTTRDTAKLLSELINDGAEGIIIDLRNNGGGSLREANELTGLFIEKGPSVQIQLADKRTYTQDKSYLSPYYDGPVVVLINRLSASASEIFAGAMQDYKRAIVVGSNSFGKGTVQSLASLNHGRIKMTESKFYRISGNSTQGKGVAPDVKLPEQFDASLIGESALDFAMEWDAIEPAKYNQWNAVNDALVSYLQKESDKRVQENPEFIYLEDKTAYEDSLDIKELSLNKKQRQAMQKADKQKRLALENQRRKAKGEKPLAALDEPEKDEDELAFEEPDTDIDTSDVYLTESANILLDYKHQGQRLVSKTD